MLGDRLAERNDRAVHVDFLGGKARFPSGPFLLAHLLSCPVYLVFALFSEPNRYDVHCELFADRIRLPRETREESVKEYAQKYAARIEHYVRQSPKNWFNFFEFWD
jgi:predicted LPLAT superfamily acyltransferase